jgi:hypothetical protein
MNRAARLAELPLCLLKLMLEALELALDTSHLTFDSFDPVDRSILRVGRDRQKSRHRLRPARRKHQGGCGI